MSLNGKVVIITGPAAGIGAAAAKLFASEGAKLCLLDVDEINLKKVEADCRELGADVLALKCDVSLLPEIDNAIAEVIQQFEGIDILVNNAIFRAIKPFLEVEEDDFDQALFTNIKGYFFFVQKVVPHMIERQGGRVINIASTFGFVGSSNLSAYCTCKGAVVNMTRAMAFELAGDNIFVNAVAPGPIMTEGMSELIQRVPSVHDSRVKDVPMGRFGTPEEIAQVCLFLASDQCSYMNGSVLVADGGFLTH